jgi:hypothetical protein
MGAGVHGEALTPENDDIMTTAATTYAFEITLHALPVEAEPGPPLTDAWGTWPTLVVPRETLSMPMQADFDVALGRLGEMPRLYVEPDGSFVWTSSRSAPSPGVAAWQVDGNAFEKDGRVLLVDLKGRCPAEEFDRLLAAFGWPGQPLMMQLVRSTVFLGEGSFRGHAAARGLSGVGKP